ncbi:Carbohydrate esterase [Phytophthora cinnamomi]|uniref:Carbohydrate esterase n=1 Tax=Phytophthora cinnamomi TaxID=4785 RepID=UPI003559CFBF|nr:Carbohydrate esterase [Phytophthora cinnamomi]
MGFRLATSTAAAVLLASAATLTCVPLAAAESICTLSDSEACSVDSLTPSDDDGSVLIYPGGNTRCAFDDYTDSVTTFSTNSTYFFQVFPNTEADKSKLMIFFQGGGACADEDTCAFGLQCSLGASATFTTAATSSSAGVLDRSLADNMFKDWNIVFIPYCTGDIHIGNRVTAAYESGIEVLLGNTQCLGLDYAMHMNGYNNTMAVLDWALENFPEVDDLIVGGESAGSLGAQVHSAKIAEMWDVKAKGTQFSVLADSYVGVVPKDHPAAELLVYYGACTNDFGLAEDIVAACEAGTATTIEMIEALLQAQPEGNWLFIDSKGDKTQRYFYALVDEGILGYPFSDLISEEYFFSNMSAILSAYQTVSSRITTFYVEGTKHVFLADSNFTSYESDEGLLLGDVINAWLVSNSSLNTGTTPEPTTETPSSTTTTPGVTTKAPSATAASPSSSSTTISPASTSPSSTPSQSSTSASSTPSSPSATATSPSTSSTPSTTTSAPLAC